MQDKFLKQAQREYSPKQRLLFLLCLAPVFLALLPYTFISLGRKIDHLLGWPIIPPAPLQWIFGLILLAPGLLFAWWSIYSQFTIGRGTPVPLMATQQLIIQPPFTYCRNPMAMGTFAAFLGVAILFQSPGAVLLVLLFALGLILYIKRFEEKEMQMRFGQEYLDYKHCTPFLFPRFRKFTNDR